MNIYDLRRRGTAIFLVISLAVVGFFLSVSNNLVEDLAQQEKGRMQIWADATREIVSGDGTDVDFLLRIIEDNTTIPVLLTDSRDSIISFRNFSLPEAMDPDTGASLSETNLSYLKKMIGQMKKNDRVITIAITDDSVQHLYYDESNLLKRLSYYPYIQTAVMMLFVIVVYFAVSSTKRAEQNKVWVGLSKETAHQLGTPISSLMAWVELLPEYGVDHEVTDEMGKDVKRLAAIASRFGKIGSKPSIEKADLNNTVSHITDYMSTRISKKINISFTPCPGDLTVGMSAPLMEWVMENLIKNAADAIEGEGFIKVSTEKIDDDKATIVISDSGKGMSRRTIKNIFNPGFTTKERGWGLGLTLAKRIVEQYHAGKISVTSRPGNGTTFTIQLPTG